MARSAKALRLVLLASGILLTGPGSADAALPPMGQWEEIATPGPRLDHTAVYDSVRDQMLVFGGHPNDAWIYHFANQSWSPLQALGVGPSTYADSKAIWDSRRNRVLLIFLNRPYPGNEYEKACEVWDLELDPAPHWILLQTQGEPPFYRMAENVLYDAVRDRLLVYGGRTDYYVFADLFELPLGSLTWHDLTPSTSPPARSEAAAVIDINRDRLVIYGGRGDNYATPLGDTWVYRLGGSAGWGQLHPTDMNSLYPRHGHSAIFEPSGNRMLIYGGIDENVPEWPYIDSGVLQLSFGTRTDPDSTASWSYLSGNGPDMGSRYGHTAVRRTAVPQMVIFGGASDYNNERGNDVWCYSLDGSRTWTQGPSLGPPAERVATSFVYDPKRHRAVLFGGWNGQYECDPIMCLMWCYGDEWNLELQGTPRWAEKSRYSYDVGGRAGQSAIYDPVRDRMVIFGGFVSYPTPFLRLNDVWTLGLDDGGSWVPITFAQGPLPPARSGHSAIYDPLRDRMIVYGGSFRSGTSELSLNDLWQLSFTGTPAWTQLTPGGTVPPAHSAHAAVYDPVRDRMIVVGGPDARVWALSLTPSLVWNELSTVGGAPAFASEVAAVYDPISDHVFVFSGTSAVAVWSLDLSSSPATWAQVTPSGAVPPPANDYTAAYDAQSDRIILFGLDPLAFGYGSGSSIGNRTWALNWGRAVPALATLVSAEAQPDRARIVWLVPGGAGTRLAVQRRTMQSEWTMVGDAVADASGLASFEDQSVTSGTRYAYRLDTGGAFAAEVWIDVPIVQAALRIEGARPNPAVHVSLALSLRSGSPAAIEFFDLRGRRVLSKRVEGLDAGAHVLLLPEADALGSGLYLVRLRQDKQTVTSRVTLLR